MLRNARLSPKRQALYEGESKDDLLFFFTADPGRLGRDVVTEGLVDKPWMKGIQGA